MRLRTLIPVTAAFGAAAIGYAVVVERNWFVLRKFEIPVLPPGTGPLRVLHISDAHLTPGRKRLMSWIRSLDDLDPHLVVNTGDSIAHRRSVELFLDSLGPLLDRPGVFVLGSNDLYAPQAGNPAMYLSGPSSRKLKKTTPDLPWEKLRDGMAAAGWLDLSNRRGQLTAGGLDVAVGAGQVRMPPGSQPAHPGAARFELRRPGMPGPPRAYAAVPERARLSARLSRSARRRGFGAGGGV